MKLLVGPAVWAFQSSRQLGLVTYLHHYSCLLNIHSFLDSGGSSKSRTHA